MKKLFYCSALFSVILLSQILHAQTTTSYTVHSNNYMKDRFFVSWEMAFPDNGDYLSKTSFAGGRLNYRKMVKPDLSLGIGLSWNSFEDHSPKQTYQKPDGSGAVTTDVVRFIYTLPITIEAHHYFKTSGKLQPYAGVGIGAQYSEQTAYFNVYALGETNWGFVLRPEVGAVLPLGKGVGAFVSGAYNFSTNSSDAFDISNIHHFSLNLGVAFGFL